MKFGSLASFESMTLRRELLHFGWVGPANFLIGYGSFLFFLYLFSRSDYWLALTASHFISSSVAFALYRRFVFRTAGNLLTDYLRFQSTYVFAYVLNVLFLLLLVETIGWRIDLAQLVALIAVAVATFIGHKYFSFSRREGQNRDSK
jgi:putative flippase GtrA